MRQRAARIGAVELERLQYRQGQLLRSRDFRDQAAIEAQLRWWHNRALHNAFGVAEGLSVEVNSNSVIVQPGLAYDCFGRELILAAPGKLRVPPKPAAATQLTLVVRYRESSALRRKRELAGACLPGRIALRTEQVELVWAPAGAIELADSVPLGTLLYDESGTGWNFKAARNFVRPLARPRIGSGITIPGRTNWKEWDPKIGQTALGFLGFETSVDTSASGFTDLPCYFAWLEGIPSLHVGQSEILPVIISQHIAEASILGFRFRFLAMLPVHISRTTGPQPAPTSLFVCWLGIQHEARGRLHFRAKEVGE